MPNHVQAAAEGMPTINRRNALAVTGAGLTAALAGVAASSAHAAISPLPAIIEDHKKAYAAFEAAIGVEWEADARYFEQNPKKIMVPLSIGGGVDFYVADDLEDYAADVKQAIVQRYEEQAQRLRGLDKIEPALVAQVHASLAKHRAADLRNLRRMVKAEQAKREASGLEPAIRNRDETSEAEREALNALCALHCTTPDEYDMKARYLLSATGGRHGDLQRDDYAALLRSFLTAEA